MTPSDVADLFYSNPDAAFRLTLNSGDVVEVWNPNRSPVDSSGILHVGLYDDADARIAKRMQYVSVMNIALIERIDPRRVHGRRRRP